MTRTEFEQFRDLDGKTINRDITFSVKGNHRSLLAAERIPIENALGLDAKLEIHYNPDTDAKILTIHAIEADGPICRLCVDNGPHPPHMTSHKHALLTPRCPKTGLHLDMSDKSNLDGLPMIKVFQVFCEKTKITHVGKFNSPVA